MSDEENYLKTKMELMMHELQIALDNNDIATAKKILAMHRKTLDTYGTGVLNGFVPLNLDHQET